MENMEHARLICDELEAAVPHGEWPLATYKELLFLDSNQGSRIAPK